MGPLVLLVDDRMESRDLLASELGEIGCRVVAAEDGELGWREFRRQRFDLVISDLRMPGRDGMELLRLIRGAEAHGASTPVLLLSAYGSLSIATEAGRAGVTDFFPLDKKGIEQLLERAQSILRGASESPLPEIFLGNSASVTRTRDQLKAATRVSGSVLIVGESGTGRSAAADYLHALSIAAAGKRPQVIRCGRDRAVPAPDHRAVVLEDFEALTLNEQADWISQLHRLEARGVRVVASSAFDPTLLLGDDHVLPEFVDRVSQFSVQLPPLRDRLEDLAGLTERFLEGTSKRTCRGALRVTPAALTLIQRYPWPGNLPELRRALDRVARLTEGLVVTRDQLEQVLDEIGSPLERVAKQRERSERAQLLELYRKHGSFAGVARELGLTRNGAKYRFAKHGLLPAVSGSPCSHSRDG